MENTEATRMEKVRRAARVARIIERLQKLDDGTLEVLDRIAGEAMKQAGPVEQRRVSRRSFLGTVAGGAVVAVTGGLAVWQIKLNTAHTAALQDEVAALHNLVSLYDEMDDTGLDAQVEQGLATVGTLVGTVGTLADGLGEAIETVRSALLDFRSRFPSLRSGFQWLEGNLTTLSQRILSLENEINQALDLSGPSSEITGGFLAEVLDWLPYTQAQRLRGGLERIGEIVAAVPDLVQGIYSRVLEPMDDWFSSSDSGGLNGWIINPLLDTVLEPAQSLAENTLSLTTEWEEKLVTPAQSQLQRRQELRAEIARLRQERGL